jgi:hypothetical protein
MKPGLSAVNVLMPDGIFSRGGISITGQFRIGLILSSLPIRVFRSRARRVIQGRLCPFSPKGVFDIAVVRFCG